MKWNSNYTYILIAIIVLIIGTYWNTMIDIQKQKEDAEHFASKSIPEFDWKTLEQHDKACKAMMDKCKDPFCIDLATGRGPLMDCIKEYGDYFGQTNGLIPSYKSGDWSGFSF